MTSASVTAVIVTFNSAHVVGKALASLRPSHETGLLESVVIDNDSGDKTVERVRREHPWARVVATRVNHGYGRACNLGLEAVETPYVLFMNPDAELGIEALRHLLEHLQQRGKAGMAAPAIREGSDYQFAGGLASPWTIVARAAGLRPRSHEHRRIVPGGPPFKTDWLCGAILMMPTAVAREVGGFDPAFFLYFEETDLCRRLLRAGLELWAVGTAVATHDGGASAATSRAGMYAGCIAEHYFRSRYYYLVKHWGTAIARSTEVAELALLRTRRLWRRLRRRDTSSLAAGIRRPVMKMPTFPEVTL